MFSKEYQLRKIAQYKENKEIMIKDSKELKGVFLRKRIHYVLCSILHIRNRLYGFQVKLLEDRARIQQNETVVYAVTHIGKFDFEMLMAMYKGFFYPVAGDWELMYGTIDDYFLRLNGVLYCDTEDKEDRYNTLQMMIKAVQQGISILIFPEGIWNLSENLPMLKIYSGVVKVAQKCNIPIVPIAIDQREKNFLITIGDKLYVHEIEEKQAIQKLRDTMATLKWEIWEKYPIEKRSNVPNDYYEKFLQDRISEWPQFNLDIINGRVYKEKYKEQHNEQDR